MSKMSDQAIEEELEETEGMEEERPPMWLVLIIDKTGGAHSVHFPLEEQEDAQIFAQRVAVYGFALADRKSDRPAHVYYPSHFVARVQVQLKPGSSTAWEDDWATREVCIWPPREAVAPVITERGDEDYETTK